MASMDVLMKYLSDPSVEIIGAGQTDRIIVWLADQTPETWHAVVQSWNYDHGDKVLTWVLQQDRCDRGTAARVFLVEGVGSWLWNVLDDQPDAEDPGHVCRVVLHNWHRYQTGEFKPDYRDIPDSLLQLVAQKGGALFADTPLHEILNFEGNRDAVSEFASQDGKIVVALDHWMKLNGFPKSVK